MVTRRGGITGIVPLAGDEPVPLEEDHLRRRKRSGVSTVVEGPEPIPAAWGDAA